MIEVIDKQRRRRMNLKAWREFGARALQAIDSAEPDATVVFVSDEAIKELNRRFRGQNYVTDVLSFPHEAEVFERDSKSQLGEVVISVQRAAAQAKQNGLSFQNEVEQLVLHGLLHLCGYDHEKDDGEMNRIELKLRTKLGI
jgi:probable rRNA maturation factor